MSRADINPAVGAMLKSASDWLLQEHSLFQTLDLKPLLIGRNKATFSVYLPDAFCDGDGNVHGSLLAIIMALAAGAIGMRKVLRSDPSQAFSGAA